MWTADLDDYNCTDNRVRILAAKGLYGSDLGSVLAIDGYAAIAEIDMDGSFSDLSDVGIGDIPDGISVWEGRFWYQCNCESSPCEDGHEQWFDHSEGSWRPATPQEFALFRSGECPWTESYAVKK